MSSNDAAVLALDSIVVAKGIENGHSNHSHDAGTNGMPGGTYGGRGQTSGKQRDGKQAKVSEESQQARARKQAQESDDASAAGSEAKSTRSRSAKTRRRKAKKSSRGASKGEEYELDGLGDSESEAAKARKPFWLRRRFWTFWVPLLWTLLLGVIGVFLRIFSPFRTAQHVQLWRFFLFLAGLPLDYVLSTFLLQTVVWFFESQFFTTSNVLYFVVALRSPARYVLMALLLLPLYIPLFAPQAGLSRGANAVYHRVLQVIACVIVFCCVQFLKVLLAKLMSSYFHSSTHFAKMQEALDKEYYLKVLATPHTANTYRDLLEPGAGGGEASQAARRRPATGLGRMKPRRFMSKLSGGLEKVAGASWRRAESMPLPDDGERGAAGAGGGGGLPTVRTLPELRHGETFEPPDPVAPTPRGARGEPASPSPFAYLSKASVPVHGAAAASTAKANPAARTAVGRFQQSLADDRERAGDAAAALGAREPQLTRRNSDGGAGVAGILQGMSVAEGQHTLASAARPQASAKARQQLAEELSADEGKSSRRGRRQGSNSSWARQRRASERGPEPIQEEPEAFEELPSRGEEMTDDRGVALVATIHQVEKHLRRRQMNIPFADQLKKGGTGTSEPEARKLAFFLFWNIKPFQGRNYIMQSDLEAFLSPRRAADAFAMLDRDGDGRLTLAELRSSIEEIFRERDNLAMQLRDTKSVVGKLELVVGVAMHVVALLIYLVIFGVDVAHVWTLFASIFLGFAFIFGNSVKNLFEAVLFLFVEHPFDTGDYVILETGDRMQVEEISLLSITMRRGDGTRLWVPLTQLVPKTLVNISRSDAKSESFKFLVDVGVRAEVLAAVDRAVGEFVEARETDFAPGHGVQLTACSDPLKLALSCDVAYSHNGVDGGKLAAARSDLLQVISDTLTELRVSHTQAPLRTIAQ